MNSYLILAGLMVLIVFPPLAIGSVYIVTYSAMEIVVFGLLLLHIWSFKYENLNGNWGIGNRTWEQKKRQERSKYPLSNDDSRLDAQDSKSGAAPTVATNDYLRKTFYHW
jgi:hypothetical protein